MSVSKTSEYLLRQHPLQRLPSPDRGTSALVHLLGLASFLSSFKFLIENPNNASEGFGWHFVFLTIIGLALSTCTFTVGLLADVTLSRRLFLLKNILSVCSAPLEVLISVLYWGLRSIDPNLVVPPDELHIPFHVDLGFHLVPSVVMLVDILFLSPPWTITALPSMALSSCIAFGYWFWIEKCYSVNGCKMHASVASASIRSVMLSGGSRFSCCLTPFHLTGSSTAAAPQQVIKRGVSQFSTKCSASTQSPSITSFARANRVTSHKETKTTSSQFIITSLRRSFSSSAGLCATPPPSSKTGNAALLDWNTFFKLRASRRRYSLISSVLASLASTAVGVQVLSAQDLDTLGAQVMGLDPFIVLGLATAACGALGWLIGPILGNTVWGLVHRQYRGGIAIKEKEFFNRIKRFRVDPSANSIANPVPDYYGEKIGSVQGYRQWLKDQRAYNRKKSRHII
ncbi:uncharacterized protein BHQ10_004249 [Talaromyces amestolkiae]|uniref:Presequence translocated-associated motor subunit PAM17 n=1 Tax=Talaromyces amestolkiae TaxID=1196081 RepID=A0A364KXF4_TALAM|nr:uncharacterized protein BHQ10_004249 [Talaromyces amestolkiae]RAO68237.1 hypothetical protein BHQ10_004249 [Talaromyces amestolkiae]